MWPMIIGAGLNLAGGLMGSSAEKKANQQNYELAMQNLGWDKEKFNKLLAEAQRQEAEGKLGQTDAQGNRVSFVPGKGWVTELSPQQKFMQALQNQEEEKQMAQDVPLKRERMFANVAGQRGEGDYADALLSQLKSERMDLPGAEVGRRNLASAEGINEGYDTALNTAMRNAQRTGNSNAGLMAEQIAKGRGDALRSAFMANETGAREASDARYGGKVANDVNLYNMFRTRASGGTGVEYNPRTISSPQGAVGGGQTANQNLLTAMGRPTPQLNYQHPAEMGMANTVSQLGNNIFAGFGGQQSGGSGGYGGFSAAPTYGRDYYNKNAGPW